MREPTFPVSCCDHDHGPPRELRRENKKPCDGKTSAAAPTSGSSSSPAVPLSLACGSRIKRLKPHLSVSFVIGLPGRRPCASTPRWASWGASPLPNSRRCSSSLQVSIPRYVCYASKSARGWFASVLLEQAGPPKSRSSAAVNSDVDTRACAAVVLGLQAGSELVAATLASVQTSVGSDTEVVCMCVCVYVCMCVCVRVRMYIHWSAANTRWLPLFLFSLTHTHTLSSRTHSSFRVLLLSLRAGSRVDGCVRVSTARHD